MKQIKIALCAALATAMLSSCKKEDSSPSTGKGNSNPSTGNVTLQFENVVSNSPLRLGTEASNATPYTSNGQIIKFKQLKYVISNIVLVKEDGSKVPYHTEDLEKGATVIDASDANSLSYILSEIPVGKYKGIEFGLGVKKELNNLKLQERFPNFYRLTGAFNHPDGLMHWEWANGYRFTKIEGWYGSENKAISIHTGSAFKGTKTDANTWELNSDRDAFRYITLDFPAVLSVGEAQRKVVLTADLDKLINGTNKITLEGNIPTVHHLTNMFPFVNNIGGNQNINGEKIIISEINSTNPATNLDQSTFDKKGMFSVKNIE